MTAGPNSHAHRFRCNTRTYAKLRPVVAGYKIDNFRRLSGPTMKTFKSREHHFQFFQENNKKCNKVINSNQESTTMNSIYESKW